MRGAAGWALGGLARAIMASSEGGAGLRGDAGATRVSGCGGVGQVMCGEGGGPVMGFWSDLGIWLSGIGGGGEVMGFWSDLWIWLSGIGGGGRSWDSEATLGCGCRV